MKFLMVIIEVMRFSDDVLANVINRQSAICDLLSPELPREGLGFDTRIHQIKTVKTSLFSTSKQQRK